jgi:hypothetical protein
MTATALALVNHHADCRRPVWSPEQRLWGAVLADALECLRLGRNAAQARAARAWVLSEAVEFGSFVYICCALRLDPDAVRDRVTRGRLRRVTGRGR